MNRDYKKPRLGASWRIGRDVVMNEGRGALYRGLAPNLVGNMASWSLYFMLYVLPQPFFPLTFRVIPGTISILF